MIHLPKHRTIYTLLAFLTALSISGCEVKPVDTCVTDVNPLGWTSTDTVKVAYENSDTVSLRDLFITIRTNSDFRYGNMPVTVRTYAPDSTYTEEVVALLVKEIDYGTFSDSDTPYRLKTRLSQKGVYNFLFIPVIQKAFGVEAIGIRFVPSL